MRLGDAIKAESLAQNLNKRFPLDTQVRSSLLPAIRAQLALNRNHAAEAITDLQAASSIELGAISFVTNISCLYPTYISRRSVFDGWAGLAGCCRVPEGARP